MNIFSIKKYIYFIIAIFFIAIQACITSAKAENDVKNSQNTQVNNEAAIPAELSKIKQEKSSIEAKSKEQEAACYKKFAVSDCLKDVKAEKLAALNTLKRREIELNDTLRQSKMTADQEKRKTIAEKKANNSDTPESKEVVAKDKKINKEQSEKTERLPSKARPEKAERLPSSAADEKIRNEAAARRAAKSQEKLASSKKKNEFRLKKAKQTSAESEKYNKKLLEAEARKNAAEQEKLNKTKPKAKPLPMPADLKP
jgi:colicin import membrane protein